MLHTQKQPLASLRYYPTNTVPSIDVPHLNSDLIFFVMDNHRAVPLHGFHYDRFIVKVCDHERFLLDSMQHD